MHPRLILIIFIFTIPLLFAGCRSEDPEEIWEADRNKLLSYIVEHGLNATEHPLGIFYVMEVEGTGPKPTVNSLVHVKYTGKLIDGSVFDSGSTELLLFQTIRGWQIGIPLFRVGGRGKLLIPSALAYGAHPPRGSIIPRNAPLVFEIELIDQVN